MQQALEAFERSMERVRDMHALHASLSQQLTAAVDLSDILRSEIVMAVSAFDFFIHELTRLGMIECHAGTRARPPAYDRFQLPMSVAVGLSEQAFNAEIRARHGYLSFQAPDKVADAIRLFSPVVLWDAVATDLGRTPGSIKGAWSLVVDRRNKIAHEADIDPSYPEQRWPIDRTQVEYTVNLVEIVARSIFHVAV